MSKVKKVDAALCVGCGVCEQACPEVFIVEDGLAKIKGANCSQHNIKDVAEQCPVQAIIVED
jgi:ferredoxin